MQHESDVVDGAAGDERPGSELPSAASSERGESSDGKKHTKLTGEFVTT